MPVRKIPRSYTQVTGKVASPHSGELHGFESPLEKDFMHLLDFNLEVKRYEEQPVRIEYTDAKGRLRHYTPDILVHYRGDYELGKKAKTSELYEVKSRKWLKRNWYEYEERFRAAIRYAKNRGWRFRIITDREIRTPYLDNAIFLLFFSKRREPIKNIISVQRGLEELNETTPQALLNHITSDRWKQAEILPAIWSELYKQKIGANFNQKITMNSRIWYVGYSYEEDY